MARPKRGNYATGPAGDARYKKNLREYLKKQKELQEKKTKITSTKKNIEKQKTANKKAATTTKTTKGKTSAKPTSTAAKGKSLATGKTTSKTKAVETPQTKTATKTRTRTRTQTKSKTTPKTTPKSKTTPKTTPKSKTPARTTNKQPTKQPAKRGRPVGSKNKPRLRRQLGNFVKRVGKGAKDLSIKGYKKGKGLLDKSVKAYKNTPQTPLKKPETRGQKAASGLKDLAKRTFDFQLENARKAKANIKNPKNIKSNVGGSALGLGAYVGEQRIKRLTDRAFKPKNMTLAEYREAKKKSNEEGVRKAGLRIKKLAGNVVNKVRGKGNNNQSSTTKNINKQKKANNQTVKKQKTNVNPQADKLKIAKQRVRKAKGYNKEKLQREVRYLEKFGKQGRTWSNPVGAKGNNKPSSVKTDTSTKSPKPGSARAKMRAKNVERFGKAHVDRLVAKNKEFQSIKRIKNREERKKKREAYRQKYGR